MELGITVRGRALFDKIRCGVFNATNGGAAMTSYILNHLPKTYRGRVNWYVSPHHGEIHLFNTQREAIDYAAQLPAFVDHFGIVFRHQIDWIPYGENGRICISDKRPIVDHRTCERRAVGYQNGRMIHIGASL